MIFASLQLKERGGGELPQVGGIGAKIKHEQYHGDGNEATSHSPREEINNNM